jgi:hypothetical protein
MAQVTRVNGGVATPVTKSVNQMVNGDLTMMTLDTDGVDISAKFGVGGAVEYMTKTIQNAGLTIAAIGEVGSPTDQVRIAVEGVFGTDSYDGTNDETLAVYLESVFAADTAVVDGVDISAVTVAAFAF